MNIKRLIQARYPWTYSPGLDDLVSPNVIRGHAIESGARVRVAREHAPTMPGWTKAFRMIEDTRGNVQSVWKHAIHKVA